jgi:hypothetical protein
MTEPTINTVATIDPASLSDFEKAAIDEFVRTAHSLGHQATTCRDVRGCGLFLVGEAAEAYGEDCPAYALYQDELGNWTALIRRPGRTDSVLTCQFIGGKDVR